MRKPEATIIWEGPGKTGEGKMSTRSGVLNNASYNFKSRFTGGEGTNPEELIAAAHAGCFTMKLAFNLEEAGYTAEKLETTCSVTFIDGTIKASNLELNATIPGIPEEEFKKLVFDAEKNCPVSKLMNADIKVQSKLN